MLVTDIVTDSLEISSLQRSRTMTMRHQGRNARKAKREIGVHARFPLQMTTTMTTTMKTILETPPSEQMRGAMS